MIFEAKRILEILEAYEHELYNAHIKLIAQRESKSMEKMEVRDRLKTITAAQVEAVREIRERFCIPEIKA
jgi:hypothetical protein